MTKLKVDFDKYTDNYNSLLRESTGFFSESEIYFAKYKVDIFKNQVDHCVNKILEYGCGIGRNIPFIKTAFVNAIVEGSDISAASLDIARNENPDVNFYIDNGGFEVKEVYDAIFIAGVFHHIPVEERNFIMQTVYHRLVPGGTVVVFEHNPYNPVTRKIVNDCPYDEDAVLLRPNELKRLFVQSGFDVLDHEYCLFIPPSMPLLFPLEKKLGWLPLGGQYWVKAKRPL